MARARIGPAAALIDGSRGLVAACEENRLTRARYAPPPGPPALARAELLTFLERLPTDVSAVGVVEDDGHIAWADGGAAAASIDGHQAHAAYAFHASGFRSGLAIVSEVHKPRGWTAWRFEGGRQLPRELGESLGDFPLAKIYGQLTQAMGFQPMRDEHLIEAMARSGSTAATEASDLITLTEAGVVVDAAFNDVVRRATTSADPDRAARDVAASVQRRLGECLVELLNRIAALEPGGLAENLCLSGGLFFNTFFTTAAATCGTFKQVYVPPHPGRNGTALGAALISGGSGLVTSQVSGSPYLGPGYSDGQIKEALDNCKLSYDFVQGDRLNDAVLHALVRGRLVGWFHGRLEWGPRALGHRSVLASPFAPHVLENLNGFLKRRPSYRSYGVSVPRSQVEALFDAPGSKASPFMQFEYRPRDPDKFRTILPRGVETLRVHTVDEDEPRFLRLLEMWGQKTGTPVLVNTSFNGFHEPLVCSPRDAIRVFYGTGLDILALGDFFLRK